MLILPEPLRYLDSCRTRAADVRPQPPHQNRPFLQRPTHLVQAVPFNSLVLARVRTQGNCFTFRAFRTSRHVKPVGGCYEGRKWLPSSQVCTNRLLSEQGM